MLKNRIGIRDNSRLWNFLSINCQYFAVIQMCFFAFPIRLIRSLFKQTICIVFVFFPVVHSSHSCRIHGRRQSKQKLWVQSMGFYHVSVFRQANKTQFGRTAFPINHINPLKIAHKRNVSLCVRAPTIRLEAKFSSENLNGQHFWNANWDASNIYNAIQCAVLWNMIEWDTVRILMRKW